MRLDARIRKQRQRRAWRVRNRIRKDASGRPRLTVFRSNRFIYAQIIDDARGHTLVAASSRELRDDAKAAGGNKAAAEAVGRRLAELALEKGIKRVTFDRGRYRFHGRVAALANAVRAAGIEF